MNIEFRTMVDTDWPRVAEVYHQGIDTKNSTFESVVPSWESWDRSHLESCRIVAVSAGAVIGWGALVGVSARKVYSGVAEVSIYIADNFKKQGIGSLLMDKLIAESEAKGFWTLQAVMFPENTASLRLHKNKGFRIVGYREHLGKMDGKWRDVILLERRSKVNGID
jgi:phosphinothricin acetyltransferase